MPNSDSSVTEGTEETDSLPETQQFSVPQIDSQPMRRRAPNNAAVRTPSPSAASHNTSDDGSSTRSFPQNRGSLDPFNSSQTEAPAIPLAQRSPSPSPALSSQGHSVDLLAESAENYDEPDAKLPSVVFTPPAARAAPMRDNAWEIAQQERATLIKYGVDDLDMLHDGEKAEILSQSFKDKVGKWFAGLSPDHKNRAQQDAQKQLNIKTPTRATQLTDASAAFDRAVVSYGMGKHLGRKRDLEATPKSSNAKASPSAASKRPTKRLQPSSQTQLSQPPPDGWLQSPSRRKSPRNRKQEKGGRGGI